MLGPTIVRVRFFLKKTIIDWIGSDRIFIRVLGKPRLTPFPFV